MTQKLIERSHQRHAFVGLPVIVIALSLAVSLVIAAIAVSIGIARADALMPADSRGTGRLLCVLFVGFVIAGMGGLAAVALKSEISRQRRD